MADRWWKIQEPGDSKPVAVAFLGDPESLLRRYVPGEGLVDWPPLAMWILGDEPGATEITEDEAIKLMKAKVGKLPSGRGSAKTVGTPEGV